MENPTNWIIIMIVCFIGLSVVIALAVILPILGLFGGIGWFFSDRAKKARTMLEAAQTWPSTRGTILKSRVQVSGGERTSVAPLVEYSYQVAAQEFTSTQIKAGEKFLSTYSEIDSYDVVDRFPVGTDVEVYYNPKNPADSALER